MGATFQLQLDELDTSNKLKSIDAEIVKETQFICELYRKHDITNWPNEKKTIDQIRGHPEPKLDVINVSENYNKMINEPQLLSNDSNYLDDSSDDDDSDDSDDSMNAGKARKYFCSKMKANIVSNRSNNNNNNNNNKNNDNLMNVDEYNQETTILEIDEDNDDQDDEEECNGLQSKLDKIHQRFKKKLVGIDPNQIDYSMSSKEVAEKSMIVWLNLCDFWVSACMDYEPNMWLGEELYLDPLLAMYIANKLPLLEYLMINLKKLFAGSNNNMPCERAFKFPKFCIGMYGHKSSLETVADFQNINEMQLNQEMEDKINEGFDETPYLILQLIEVICLQQRFEKCEGIQKLYIEAQKRTKKLQKANPFWS